MVIITGSVHITRHNGSILLPILLMNGPILNVDHSFGVAIPEVRVVRGSKMNLRVVKNPKLNYYA